MSYLLDQEILQLHNNGILAADMRKHISGEFSDKAVRLRIRDLGILEKEIAALGQLKADADAVKAKIAALEKDLIDLGRKKAVAEARVVSLEREKVAAEVRATAAEQAKLAAEVRVIVAERAKEEAEDRVEVLEQSKDEADRKAKTALDALEQAKAEVNATRANITSLAQAKDRTEAEVLALKKEITDLEQARIEAIAKIEGLEKAKSDVEAEKKAAEVRVAAAEQAKKEAEDKVVTLEQAKYDAEVAKAQAENKVAVAEQEKEAATTFMVTTIERVNVEAETKIATLAQAKKIAEVRVAAAEQAQRNAEGKVAILEQANAESEAAKTNITILEQEFVALGQAKIEAIANFTMAEAVLKQLNTELNQTNTDLAQAKKDLEITKADADVNIAKAEAERREAGINAASALEQLNTELHQANTDLAQAKKDLEITKADADVNVAKAEAERREAGINAASALEQANTELNRIKEEAEANITVLMLAKTASEEEAEAAKEALVKANAELKQAKQDEAKEKEANLEYKKKIEVLEDKNAELVEQNQQDPTSYPAMAAGKGDLAQDNKAVALPQNSQSNHFFTPFTLTLTLTLIGSVYCNCHQYRQKKIIMIKLTRPTKNNDLLTRVQQASIEPVIEGGEAERERDEMRFVATKAEAVDELEQPEIEAAEKMEALEEAKASAEAKVIAAERARDEALSRATVAEQALEQAKEALEHAVSRAEAVVKERLERVMAKTEVALGVLERAKKVLELAKTKIASLEKEKAEAEQERDEVLAANGLNVTTSTIRRDNEVQETHLLHLRRASGRLTGFVGTGVNNVSIIEDDGASSEFGIIEGIEFENNQDILGMARERVRILTGILETLIIDMVSLRGLIHRLESGDLEENGLREINRLYNSIGDQTQAVLPYINAEHVDELRMTIRQIDDLSEAIQQLIEPMPLLRDLMERGQLEQLEVRAFSELIGARIEEELLHPTDL